MNRVELSGRLTKKPVISYSQNGSSVARFSLAVDRTVKRGDNWEHEADFIPCVCFGKKAEFVEKYFDKGDFAIVTGNIKTGSYDDKDGVRHYTTDVWAENIEFGGSKSDNAKNTSGSQANVDNDGFMNIPDCIDEEVPFN
ncbi:MAG: single-stranded DNA-binding protein [Lachnospiraceae bacterium]|nr:single-stranded DNA-binding protein [Lachnospiraceae bacterium]